MVVYTLKINEVVLDILMNSNNNSVVINKLCKYGQVRISVLAAFLFTFIWIFWWVYIYMFSSLE